jgi:hypothetical protein
MQGHGERRLVSCASVRWCVRSNAHSLPPARAPAFSSSSGSVAACAAMASAPAWSSLDRSSSLRSVQETLILRGEGERARKERNYAGKFGSTK